ncbi:hypothetical protein B0H15DRAFT_831449 [Mycena belliarum]|uniref:F-box domain-containing protein n=1 Tax=Mycena belliarum TaxID=1033014 RepID=A0AAD6U7G8_9AGAR|nr:hypothetical protein B0H15DRAFT_831449 [Mycena belliae]
MDESFRATDLPPELFVHILSFLPNNTLCACLQASRLLHETIKNSTELQYYMERNVARVNDNPYSPLPAVERLRMLRAREDAFDEMKASWATSVPVPFPTSGLYEVSAGFFFLGELQRQALRYLELPSKILGPPPQWGSIPTPNPASVIIDFGLAIEEHDLVAMATMTPTGRVVDEVPEGLINLELLTMSEPHAPHPQARGAIEIHTSIWGLPSIILEIVGDYLVFVEGYRYRRFGSEPPPNDHVYVFEWKTGKLRMRIEADSGTYFAAVFVSPDVLLLPNTITAALELWTIPPATQDTEPEPALTLHLPRLVPGQRIRLISARGEPNPSVYAPRRPARLPFQSAPEESIIVFHLNFLSAQFLLFTHRRALLALLRAHEPGDAVGYAEWGPDVCRWIDAAGMNMDWITTTAGQRCVLILDRPISPFFVLDFNAGTARGVGRRTMDPDEDPFGHHGIWAEAVGSRLKCHIRRGQQEFSVYDGVSLDEERLIALRRNPVRQIGAVDLFYFGG